MIMHQFQCNTEAQQVMQKSVQFQESRNIAVAASSSLCYA